MPDCLSSTEFKKGRLFQNDYDSLYSKMKFAYLNTIIAPGSSTDFLVSCESPVTDTILAVRPEQNPYLIWDSYITNAVDPGSGGRGKIHLTRPIGLRLTVSLHFGTNSVIVL